MGGVDVLAVEAEAPLGRGTSASSRSARGGPALVAARLHVDSSVQTAESTSGANRRRRLGHECHQGGEGTTALRTSTTAWLVSTTVAPPMAPARRGGLLTNALASGLARWRTNQRPGTTTPR